MGSKSSITVKKPRRMLRCVVLFMFWFIILSQEVSEFMKACGEDEFGVLSDADEAQVGTKRRRAIQGGTMTTMLSSLKV